MTGFGNSRGGGQGNPLARLDNDTLGIIGTICAVAGFFTFGLILGPIAFVAGWFAMGRRWGGSRHVTALIAVVLGAIDFVLSIIWLAGAHGGPGFL